MSLVPVASGWNNVVEQWGRKEGAGGLEQSVQAPGMVVDAKREGINS